MLWASALSEKGDFPKAVEECAARLQDSCSAAPDLLFAFTSPHHGSHFEQAPELLKKALGAAHLVGCSGGGIIGGGREVENRSSLSLTAAWLPGVSIRSFHVTQETMPDPDAAPKAWREWTGAPANPATGFVLLSDPFSLNAEDMTRGLDYAYPGSVTIGGLASGSSQPGTTALFLNERRFDRGAVGIALSGNIAVDPLVAQGCRPIGDPLKITNCEHNLLVELDGKQPLAVLESILESLSPEDKELARSSLFLGIISDASKSGDSKRDYLIRNLVGLDAENGILAIGAFLRLGQTVRFHLRDRKTSALDLKERLSDYRGQKRNTRPEGALLFSCLGRGERLYRTPNHDTALFQNELGTLPIGGFFCNGEIGPVDGSTYLHGFTSCFGIFRALEASS